MRVGARQPNTARARQHGPGRSGRGLGLLTWYLAALLIGYVSEATAHWVVGQTRLAAVGLLLVGSLMMVSVGYVLAPLYVPGSFRERLRSGARLVTVSGRRFAMMLGLFSGRSGRRRLTRDVGWGLLVGFALLGLVDVLAYVVPWPPPWMPADPRDAMFVDPPLTRSLTAAALSAPLQEEVIYRAPLLVLASALRRSRRMRLRPGWSGFLLVAAVLVSTAAFAAAHQYSLSNLVTAGIAGLTFSIMVLRCRSLVPAMVAHAVFNMAVTLMNHL